MAFSRKNAGPWTASLPPHGPSIDPVFYPLSSILLGPMGRRPLNRSNNNTDRDHHNYLRSSLIYPSCPSTRNSKYRMNLYMLSIRLSIQKTRFDRKKLFFNRKLPPLPNGSRYDRKDDDGVKSFFVVCPYLWKSLDGEHG